MLPWDEIKKAPPVHDIESESVTADLNINFRGKHFPASLLPCKWTSETSPNSWFYLGTADNFDGYTLFIIENDELKFYGLVMDFLNLSQVSENGYEIFQNVFKNFITNQCK